MTQRATINHVAVKVKDINGMIQLMEELLDFHVSRRKGEGEVPSRVWFEEGLQLVHDPDFDGPEGRLHHLGMIVSDREALVHELERRGYVKVRPNWYALPDGLVLELLEK